MLTYLYTLDYDDDGDAGSPDCYLLNVNSESVATALPEQEAKQHQKLMNNVVVYAIAEKYNIVELEELAKAKFEECLDQLVLSELYLPPIVDAIYGTTPSTDQGLRGVIVSTCVFWAEEILSDANAHCLINDHGELGLGMLLELVPFREEKTARLREEVSYLKLGMQEVFDDLSELGEPSDAFDKMQLSTALNRLSILINSPKPLEE